MDIKCAILALFLVVNINGLKQEDVQNNEEWKNKMSDMQFCLEQEKVSEEEMKEFLFLNKPEDDNVAVKMAVLCFTKRIKFFDGLSWNMEEITRAESKNPEMLKIITECLTKDDYTKEPHERVYEVQKCVLEKAT